MRAILVAAFLLAGIGPAPAAAQTDCGYMVREMYWVCRAKGAGDPALLLHGALASGRVWDAQADAIASSYYVAVPNLRHHGTASATTPEPYSHMLHVRDLEDLLKRGGASELRTRPVHVVGHGFGAEIALLLARALPDRVRSLVLDEPDFDALVAEDPDAQSLLRERSYQLSWVRGLAYSGRIAPAAGAYYRWLSGGDASRQWGNLEDLSVIPEPHRARMQAFAHTLAAHLTMSSPAVSCADLRALKLPVLVTMGEKTRPYFKRAAEAVARCIPGARLVVIPGAGHGAPFANPAAFNREVLAFLAKQ